MQPIPPHNQLRDRALTTQQIIQDLLEKRVVMEHDFYLLIIHVGDGRRKVTKGVEWVGTSCSDW
jgi:hypothetical protein